MGYNSWPFHLSYIAVSYYGLNKIAYRRWNPNENIHINVHIKDNQLLIVNSYSIVQIVSSILIPQTPTFNAILVIRF